MKTTIFLITILFLSGCSSKSSELFAKYGDIIPVAKASDGEIYETKTKYLIVHVDTTDDTIKKVEEISKQSADAKGVQQLIDYLNKEK